nr:MAG: RNA dependent RNA polymerase [Leviviridae sp.]
MKGVEAMKDCSSKGDLRKIAKVRVPKDYPWRLLGSLALDLRDSLNTDEFQLVQDVVRSRDPQRLDELIKAWSPQRTNSSGIRTDKFFAQYQISALLKKYRFPSDNKSRELRAFDKFKDAELDCQLFNHHGWQKLAWLEDDDELSVYTHARNFLSRLLGELLPSQEDLTLWSRHGPGANLDTSERKVSLYDKYRNWPYSCTHAALDTARSAIRSDERWLGALEDDYRKKKGIAPNLIIDQNVFWSDVLNVVDGNRITFVPKDSHTDRSIAIEPCMNLYLQLGIDGYIRRRLLRWGVNLDDQRKNQELARIGSKEWRSENPFVTLDLAAASDTISLEVCRLLLPPQWYHHLMTLRSPQGICNGEVFHYEKISSMGNGFTFALESAIFAALAYGAEKHTRGSFDHKEIAVFGDDLIVRSDVSGLLIRMLNRCGFSVNHEKSFFEGPFRESCGADWFNGTFVRPVFLRTIPSTVMELWSDCNRLRRILSLRTWGFEFEVTRLIAQWVPEALKELKGPLSDESFDSYMHTPRPTSRAKNNMWKFNRLVVRPKRLKGTDFLFRKLMHSLRPDHRPNLNPVTWGGAKLADAGSVFTVTKPSSVTVSRSVSLAWFWQDEYNAFSPYEEGLNPLQTST